MAGVQPLDSKMPKAWEVTLGSVTGGRAGGRGMEWIAERAEPSIVAPIFEFAATQLSPIRYI